MLTTAVFDLETSDLDADRGVILCGVIKSSERRDPYVFRIDREDRATWRRGKRGCDKNTVKAISAVLQRHDVLVAHNGGWFDIPMLRTRQLLTDAAVMRDMKLVDPFQIARRKFRLKSNSLGRVADFLGVKDKKTPLDMSTWADAILNGSRKSMDLIVEHCVADVEVLAAVLSFVKPFVKVLDDRGSAL